MSTVREFHDQAMRAAQLAIVARHREDWLEAERLARRAYEYESQAALLIPKERTSEPTRAILYRSAASLAYQCKEFVAAQRLITEGLSGHPPMQIRQEMEALLKEVL